MKHAISLSAWSLYMLLLTVEPNTFAHPQQFIPTVFVCSIGTAPDHCNADTAIDITYGERVTNEIMCGKAGEAVLARTALAPREGQEYIKITCPRQLLKSEKTQ